MSDSKKRRRKMGNSPLSSGGALDWIGEELEEDVSGSADGTKEDASERVSYDEESSDEESSREPRTEETASQANEPVANEPERSAAKTGLAPGFRRHTLIMREDHIAKLKQLTALEKLRSGDRLKKDVVADIFSWYFEEHPEALTMD